METIFEKPLDKQVAENTDHIANLIETVLLENQTTDANGTIITNVDWSRNFYGGNALYNNYTYYVDIRRTAQMKAVLRIYTDTGALANASGVNVYLYKINI